jgi:hypothetical protein
MCPYKSKSPVGLIHHIFQLCFHVNPLSRKSPRYLTLVISCKVCPDRVRSFSLPKSLFRVNGISPSFVD